MNLLIIQQKGIFLTSGKLDLDIMGLGTEQACIYMISKNLKTIKELYEKLKMLKEKIAVIMEK